MSFFIQVLDDHVNKARCTFRPSGEASEGDDEHIIGGRNGEHEGSRGDRCGGGGGVKTVQAKVRGSRGGNDGVSGEDTVCQVRGGMSR
jgi:hypothetical protein